MRRMMRAFASIACLLVVGCFTVTSTIGGPCTGWTAEDIGSEGAQGTCALTNGVFTLQGTGYVWDTSDRFYFVSQTYTGNFEFVARLTNLSFVWGADNPSAGIMMRENVDPGTAATERHVFVLQHSRFDPPPPAAPVIIPFATLDSIARHWKGERTVFGVPDWTSAQGYYHKLIRHGDQISVYDSANGTAWRFIEGYTLKNLAASVKVGLAVQAGVLDFNRLATATFDSVSLKPLDLGYNTSWVGNSLGGGSAAVQQNVQAMYVEPDAQNGRVFLSSYWDEASREASIIRPDGVVYGSLDAAHERPSGFAITSNGSYVYMGQVEPDTPDPNNPSQPDPDPDNLAYVIRRYNRDGSFAPFPGGQGFYGDQRFIAVAHADVDRHVRGLAWGGGVLYASDTMANTIKRYDADLASLGNFVPAPPSTLTRPRGLAIDPATGDLWVIADVNIADPNSSPSYVPKVIHYDETNGAELNQLHVPGWQPTGLTVADGVVWVADAGPDQQIKKFDASNGTPLTPFGDTGGIRSGSNGVVAPLKLNHPVAIGVDNAGNIYVAADSNGSGTSAGTELRKFNASGQIQWERYGLEFIKCGDFDPGTDGHDIYSINSHYAMDYSKETGKEWSYKGFTLDRLAYPDDIRAHSDEVGAFGGIMMRRYLGKRFMFFVDAFAHFLAIYRFQTDTSETAIPAGLFSRFHFLAEYDPNTQELVHAEVPLWPHNQPQSYEEWFWIDDSGDGEIDAGADPNDPDPNEYRIAGPNTNVWGWYVAPNMDIWAASQDDDPTIRRFIFQGLSAQGVPQYNPGSTVSFSRPPVFAVDSINPDPDDPNHRDTFLMRAIFVPPSTMYLSGYTYEHPFIDNSGFGEFGMAGREVARYDNWNPDGSGTPTLVWRTHNTLPGGVLPSYAWDAWDGVAKSIAVAGNRVYVGMADRRVHVLDAADGTLLKTYEAGPEVAGEVGLIDIPIGVNAFQRSNGDYVALMEEGYQAKNLLFRDLPTPLYLNTFASNPFSVSSGTGGSSQLVTLSGNQAVELKDTTAQNAAQGSLFTFTLSPGNALVSRINAVYGQAAGSTPVSFDLTFKLERTLASNRPLAITGGIQFDNYDGILIPQFPTGNPEPSLSPTLPYVHDEASGSEMMEQVDRFATATYRFTVVPNGGARLITGLVFRFRVHVDKAPAGQPATTPEAIAIDNLAVAEVLP
jgi:hypothetical protein